MKTVIKISKKDAEFPLGDLVKVRKSDCDRAPKGYCEDDCGEDCGTAGD